MPSTWIAPSPQAALRAHTRSRVADSALTSTSPFHHTHDSRATMHELFSTGSYVVGGQLTRPLGIGSMANTGVTVGSAEISPPDSTRFRSELRPRAYTDTVGFSAVASSSKGLPD